MALKPETAELIALKLAAHYPNIPQPSWTENAHDDFAHARLRAIAESLQSNGSIAGAASAVQIPVEQCKALIDNFNIPVPALEDLLKKPEKGFLRVGFTVPGDDGRPMYWPIPLPYWETGFGHDYVTMVAYVPDGKYLKAFWPDYRDIRFVEQVGAVEAGGRFPAPDWFDPNNIKWDEPAFDNAGNLQPK